MTASRHRSVRHLNAAAGKLRDPESRPGAPKDGTILPNLTGGTAAICTVFAVGAPGGCEYRRLTMVL